MCEATGGFTVSDTGFHTRDGQAVPAVDAATMREIDRVAVDDVGIDLVWMMEHAARALCRRVRAVADGPVTVLAGNGGNGGGGLAAARHLANRGVDVAVVLDREPAALDGAAAAHRRVLDAMGIPIQSWPAPLTGGVEGSSATIVDALVGYGLSGPLQGAAAELVAEIDAVADGVVSLDVPSGVDATTGEAPGPAVSPAETVTLALPKPGLAAIEGELRLADIGIPAVVFDRVGVPYDDPFGPSSLRRLHRSAQA